MRVLISLHKFSILLRVGIVLHIAKQKRQVIQIPCLTIHILRKDFIQQQRTQAEQAASQQASDAYVNSRRAQNSLREQLSALGLGTSGALQSGQVGLQGDYSTNLNTINSNLDSMLSNLSQQELQVLSDYYNNMARVIGIPIVAGLLQLLVIILLAQRILILPLCATGTAAGTGTVAGTAFGKRKKS